MTWPTHTFSLPSKNIDLWFCEEHRIVDPETLNRYQALLTENELEQKARFHFTRDQHRYLITRSLVRSVLSLYYPLINPHNWRFIKNQYGRPKIDNPMPFPLYFNLSHTDKMIVMAVAGEPSVGVDVESVKRRSTYDETKLADRFFSPLESRQLRALPEVDQKKRFFQLWTLKEAYIKACGKGLAIPLSEFSFSFPSESTIDVSFAPERKDNPNDWLFWHIESDNGFYISLAYRPTKKERDFTLNMFNVSPLDSVESIYIPINSSHPPKHLN